jgi:hypothetical protein
MWERKAIYCPLWSIASHVTLVSVPWDPRSHSETCLRNRRDAQAALELRIDGESWLLPDQARDRLRKFTRDFVSCHDREQDWAGMLDDLSGIIIQASDDLRINAPADLKVPASPRKHSKIA